MAIGEDVKFRIYKKLDGEGIVISLKDKDKMLDFLDFVEIDKKVKYRDSSGYDIPIEQIILSTEKGSSSVKAVIKTRLAYKLLEIVGETDNYYLISE
jgi:hypothetical protein